MAATFGAREPRRAHPRRRPTAGWSGCRSWDSEYENLVGPLRPISQLLQRTAPRAFEELCLLDASGVHAAAAHADGGLVENHHLEHAIDVVVALGDGLPRFGAGGCVAHQEDAHFFAFPFHKRAGEP